MKNTILYTSAGLMLLLAGAGCSWWGSTSTTPTSPDNTSPATSTSTVPTSASSTTQATTAPKTTTSIKTTTQTSKSTSRTYQETLNAYRDSGAYMQLVTCHASPSTISIKKGVHFMIDNRDNQYHHIVIGGKYYYTVGAYNYVLPAIPTPGTYNMTCDGGGTGQVNVEG